MKLNNPAVSVLMSVYNEPIEWIQEAIDLIIHQTFTDFEFIIVNDNPKRKELATSLVVNAEKDNRITVISNAENIGLTKSLNIGLKHCKGKYIARMDADDISLPQRFEKQYSYMSFHTEIGVCGTFAEMFGQKNAIWKVPVKHEDCAIFYETPFIHPTVFIRKKILEQYNLKYDEHFRYSQDIELWERLYRVTEFGNIPEILLRYRTSKRQVTGNPLQRILAAPVRCRALNYYCISNGIQFEIANKIDLNVLKTFKNIAIFGHFTLQHFTYFLYRSVNRNYLRCLLYFFISGDFIKMSFGKILRVVCYLVTRKIPYPLVATEGDRK